MFNNTIYINNINNYIFDFNKKLLKNNTLSLKNCDNIDIIIKSKINKLILINCKNINININDTITGIEIEKSYDVNIFINKNKKINSLNLYKSNICINKINYVLINENSDIKLNKSNL